MEFIIEINKKWWMFLIIKITVIDGKITRIAPQEDDWIAEEQQAPRIIDDPGIDGFFAKSIRRELHRAQEYPRSIQGLVRGVYSSPPRGNQGKDSPGRKQVQIWWFFFPRTGWPSSHFPRLNQFLRRIHRMVWNHKNARRSFQIWEFCQARMRSFGELKLPDSFWNAQNPEAKCSVRRVVANRASF